ncbi:glycoside hydrolase family 25 protein [uncultured Kordia sp.]|uniref:glycoside hydrolase family 25 protein n=1 Tax=uncultured Kordia sp. TaxID=507699 RepID=UPI00260F25FE|nr:glycoside hydrolase family 25 protein [uncultured Kordia sp.]
MSTQAKGIDISYNQGSLIDSIDTNNTDLSFVVCKATGGITIQDPDFAHNWETIPKKGFIRGTYHFYYTNDAPQSQADNFFNVVGNDFPSDALPPIVDFEEASVKTTDKNQIIEDLLSFLNLIEQKYGRTPMIYTDVNTGNAYLNDARLTKFPLWIANYTTKPAPTIPGQWSDWTIWQYSDSGNINGTAVDEDYFNGNVHAMKQFISQSIVSS